VSIDNKLVSKIQYKNFEDGEFIETNLRSFDEIIELIEGMNNNFIKLALYFNGKFALYYLDDSQCLFIKTIKQLPDTYDFIKTFYTNGYLDTTSFEKELTKENSLNYFATNPFRYGLDSNAVLLNAFSSFWFEVLSSIFIFILVFFLDGVNVHTILFSTMLSLLFVLVAKGRSLLHYFFYYKYAKENVLIISKNNDSFYFGPKNSPKQYYKQDILKYTSFYLSRISKDYIASKIVFKNGEILIIPAQIIDYISLSDKLHSIRGILKPAFLFLKM
jgi:hypothetical protein